jgi:Flp pilus assembly protein TadG
VRKLDQRGVAAFEFCLVLLPFLMSLFVIFDLGRYAITMQSLRAYANAGAREAMIGDCYVEPVLKKQAPDCSTADLSAVDKTKISPFLSESATLSLTGGSNVLTVTAEDDSFVMAMTLLTKPLWGTSFDKPSASTQIPF